MLRKKQKIALEKMLSGQNVFLSGDAGTGKSYVIEEFIGRCKKKGKNILICAPTGIASINVGGATMHRVFKLPTQPYLPISAIPKPSDAVLSAEIIVIDEISMCRFDMFECFARILRSIETMEDGEVETLKEAKNVRVVRKKQVVVVGDFFQLPPVITEKDRIVLEEEWGKDKVFDGHAFLSDSWEKFNFQNVVLDEIVRQNDSAYINALNDVRMGKKDGIEWFNEHCAKEKVKGIYLCGKNRDAESVNNAEISRMKNKRDFEAEISGEVAENEMPTSRVLSICIGSRIMSLVNSSDNSYQNGSLGTVLKMNKGELKIEFDNGEIAEIQPKTWEVKDFRVIEDRETKTKKVEEFVVGSFTQFPIKNAYAITIHKSQGQTYDAVNINPACFVSGQLYVALSRCKSIEKMHLNHKISQSDLIVSKQVIDFYKNIAEEPEFLPELPAPEPAKVMAREELELKEKIEAPVKKEVKKEKKMEELKARSFRITDATAEKIKEIASEIGGNQQEALAKMIETYEFQSAKNALSNPQNVEQFEQYVSCITRMYMSLEEDKENLAETIKSQFSAQLESKDSIIMNLQKKVSELEEELVSEREGFQVILKDSKEARTALVIAERTIEDKDNLNRALTDSCNQLKADAEKGRILTEENEKLHTRCRELENEILKLKTQHLEELTRIQEKWFEKR